MEPKNEQNYRNLSAALLIADLIMVIIVVKNGFHMQGTERVIYTALFWAVSTALNVCWNKASEDTEEWTKARWAVQLAYPAAFAAAMFFLMK